MITYYVQYCNEMHILSKHTTNHVCFAGDIADIVFEKLHEFI